MNALPDLESILHPAIEPYRTDWLPVSGGHEVYFEESGNPQGKPVVFLHGGPGAATDAKHRRYFDPAKYRIVLFDQRGCGKSRPHASLQDNTTWRLVDDIEALRGHLGIERWQVFGGSWGSTLALTYAVMHPARVSALVLRGIFTFLEDEVEWLIGGGASRMFPEAWAGFVAPIPANERDDLIAAYYRRLTSEEDAVRLEAALAWAAYEFGMIALRPDPAALEAVRKPDYATALARIECHYFAHRGFYERETWIYDHLERLADVPTVIVHGRYDVICPPHNAWRLHQAMPHAQLVIVPGAGHSVAEPGIARALIEATARLA